MINQELSMEIAKKQAEEYVIKKELDKVKNDFINFMENKGFDEINTLNIKDYNKPIKCHKPFKLKLKDFLNKLTKVLNL